MDERALLAQIDDYVPDAGDDAAVVDDLVLTTDMLHERTDFPDGITKYTAGWRAVGASLSDVAAMGGTAVAAVAVYGAPTIDWDELAAFVDGATDVCNLVDATYVGGDLDEHQEFTVATTALGRTENPILRSGASPGETVCVTGTLGRSGAALAFCEAGDHERANDLFCFPPRVTTGQRLAEYATSMMDSSDGLARSLHQMAEASNCGFAIESPLPVADAVKEVADDESERRELSLFFGEDFELVCTMPDDDIEQAKSETDVPLTPIGTVTESGLTLDGESLPDEGYTHGEDC